jgi:hypothetical protein
VSQVNERCGKRGEGRKRESVELDKGRKESHETHLENTLQQRTTSNTTLQLLHLRSRLVNVERTDNNQLRGRREIANRDRNLVNDVLDERVNVVPQLRRDGNDRSAVGYGALDELGDLLVVFVGLVLTNEVDFVLEDEDVLELHDLDRGQVLGGLGLRAGLVGGDEEEGGVHDGGTVEHRRHENVVTGAVDEGDVTVQKDDVQASVSSLLERTEEKGMKDADNAPKKLHRSSTSRNLTRRVVLLITAVTPETPRPLARLVLALVDLGVGVTELDGDVTLEFVLETDGVNSRDGLNSLRFSVLWKK